MAGEHNHMARSYTYRQNLSQYDVTRSEYASQNHVTQLDAAVASVAILVQERYSSSTPSQDPRQRLRVLLLKRSHKDTFPSCWELPGGTVEEQETILDAAARELKEETGLTLVSIEQDLGIIEFETGKETKKKWIKFSFLGRVDEGLEVGEIERGGGVVLDGEEHENWRWVGEEDVRGGKGEKEDLKMQFVNDASRLVILSAFQCTK